MPVFLRGRRAFCIIPAPPTSPRPTLIQSTVSPIRAVPTRTAPIRAAPVRASPTHAVPAPLPPPVTPTLPRLPRCRRLSLLPFLVYPAAATCHSYPHLVYPAAADFGYRSAARHAPLPLGPNSRTIRAPSPILPKVPPRPASLLLFCPGPPSRRPRHKKRRTEPHRGPSAAKKQPICRGSITAAALQPVRSVHSPETNPLRIVRAGISG